MFGLNVRNQRLGAKSKYYRVSMTKQVPESKPLAIQLSWASISIFAKKIRSDRTQYKIQSISHTGPVGSHWINGGGKLSRQYT